MIDLYVRHLLQHSNLCILPIQLTYASLDFLNKEGVDLCAKICWNRCNSIVAVETSS